MGHFPRRQELVIIPKPEIPPFIKSQEVISPNQLYEKCYGTDARGLVSDQMLARLNIFFGGDPEKSQKTMIEFLHNMSMQALSKSNIKILLEFDKIVDLITHLTGLLQQQNRLSIKINEENNNEAIESINNHRLYFELDPMEEIQESVDDMIKKDIIPEIPEDFILPRPLVSEEIKKPTREGDAISLKLHSPSERKNYKLLMK